MLINDDVIRKICFIEAYGHNMAESILTENKQYVDIINRRIIKHKVPFTNSRYKQIRKGVLSYFKEGREFHYATYDLIYTLRQCDEGIYCPTDNNQVIGCIVLDLDMMNFIYDYPPHIHTKMKENSLSEIEWKLDALHLYLTMDETKRKAILSENVDKLKEFKEKRDETIHQQEEAYANFQKECKIIEEQNKIRERERKKALKEEAKRRMTLEAKMESHEIYGEIIYKGEMHVIKSREDLEQLLKRMS